VLDLSDVPELMPGARPRASPAARYEFEQCCHKLHKQVAKECQGVAVGLQVSATAASSAATGSDLVAMFPTLDAALVESLAAEASSPQAAIDTLLALVAALAGPGAGANVDGARASAISPPRSIGTEDHVRFPPLVDRDGWEAVGHRWLEQSAEEPEEPGSTWRDRARAGAIVPSVLPQPRPRTSAPAAQREPAAARREKLDEAEDVEAETDYDFRHRAGRRRALQRARHGRGVGCEHGRLDVAAATGS